jgi:hypothetical protein
VTCLSRLDAALSFISTISSRIGTVFYSIFCVRFPCTPFPQDAFESEPWSSTSALANYDQLRRPILTIRFSSENKCFRFCGCSFDFLAGNNLALTFTSGAQPTKCGKPSA